MPVPVPVKPGNLNKAKQGCALPDDIEIMNNHRFDSNVRRCLVLIVPNSVQALAPHPHRPPHPNFHGELPTWRDRHVAQLRGAGMPSNGHVVSRGPAESFLPGTAPLAPLPATPYTPIEWNWDVEHADRRREAKTDASLHDAQPFQVDRRVLKDIVREKTHCEVGRITFLSSGTFHKVGYA
jgi:hypothetical protein